MVDRSTDWMRERRVNTVNNVSIVAPAATMRLPSGSMYPSAAAFRHRHKPHQTINAAGASIHSQAMASPDANAQIAAPTIPIVDTASGVNR